MTKLRLWSSYLYLRTNLKLAEIFHGIGHFFLSVATNEIGKEAEKLASDINVLIKNSNSHLH